MNQYLENKEILPDNLLLVINLIVEKFPDVVFGGSLALNAVGLLNREIFDIDLFIEDISIQESGFGKFLGKYWDRNMLSDTVTDLNGNRIQRIGLKINDVHICTFKVSDEYLQHSFIELRDGLKIKIQNVNYAIQAKISYAQSDMLSKHTKDLKEINDNLDIAF